MKIAALCLYLLLAAAGVTASCTVGGQGDGLRAMPPAGGVRSG